MNIVLKSLLPAVIVLPCALSAHAAMPPTLEPLWIAAEFDAPEGVSAAPDGTYYISNVSGGGRDVDGIGWISKISMNGEILVEKWAEGLNAPKGMTVHDGKLYVADIDRVRTFDVLTGEAGQIISVEGAKFLNDMTVFDGKVLVSDSQTARIYEVTAGDVSVWLEDLVQLDGVNGVLGDGDRLLVSTMTTGSLYEADKNGTLTEIANGMIDADGIGVVPGGYLVSAWRGEVYFVSNDGVVASLLNTREDGILQNDLSVFGDLVLVPNWQPGTVTGWKFKN